MDFVEHEAGTWSGGRRVEFCGRRAGMERTDKRKQNTSSILVNQGTLAEWPLGEQLVSPVARHPGRRRTQLTVVRAFELFRVAQGPGSLFKTRPPARACSRACSRRVCVSVPLPPLGSQIRSALGPAGAAEGQRSTLVIELPRKFHTYQTNKPIHLEFPMPPHSVRLLKRLTG